MENKEYELYKLSALEMENGNLKTQMEKPSYLKRMTVKRLTHLKDLFWLLKIVITLNQKKIPINYTRFPATATKK